MTQEQIEIYFAGSLFNDRENFFNINLAEQLESKDYKISLPQRDGFEFSSLESVLSGKLAPKEVNAALNDIIYYLDIGLFLPRSHVVTANLDEPLDAGVDVELCYARMMDKLVIGYRTDVRTPFGSFVSPFKGMHWFPAYQLDVFISQPAPCKSAGEADKNLRLLADKIDSAIQERKETLCNELSEHALNHPDISKLVLLAETLFNSIRDLHSDKGLREIADRWIKNKEKFDLYRPNKA
ncbi:MAG TPA: nucleoside 2-deoxyribosyltransferase [Candidatus Nanoarchaeia archaeon]|nr:nucleoside 2-deoxyribosyltransferase [Candidatus Nanoarchaeia archaeon]